MKKSLILLLAVSFVSSSMMAQVTSNKELQGLITQSFGYFPKVKEVQNTVSTAEQRLALTQLEKQPVVTGDASYNFVMPKIVIPFPLGPNGDLVNFQFAPVHNFNLGVNGSYSLIDFGKFKADIEKSKQDLQYAKHNVDYVKSQLANQVSMIYYNIIFLKKAVSIQDSVLNYLNDNKSIVDAKLRNGDALKIDVLNIQSNIDATQNQKVDLQNQLQKQLNLLEYTTGVKQEVGKDFDFDVNFADIDAALGIAQATNLDFVLAKDRIKQAQNDMSIVKLNDKPSVGLRGGAGVKNGYVPDVAEMRFNYFAGIALSIPIYNGGKLKQQVKLQETIVKQNELAQETLSSNYRKDIAQALVDLRSNLERINNTKGQIDDAVAAEQLAAIRFKNGVGTNLEITNASTNVQRAYLTRLQYEYQLCLAKVELARLMGYTYWQ
jgi:outer membrane protein TolC